MVYSWTGRGTDSEAKDLFTTHTTAAAASAAFDGATTISGTPGENGRWVVSHVRICCNLLDR